MTDTEERVSLAKVAKFVAGAMMTSRFLAGTDPSIVLQGPEVDKMEKDIMDQLRNL